MKRSSDVLPCVMRCALLRSCLLASLWVAGIGHPRAADAAHQPAATVEDEIRRVAEKIEKYHVAPADRRELLREAARALDAELGASARPGPEADDPGAAIEGAVTRLRAARPDVGDARIIAIAVGAMASSLKDSSGFLDADEVQRIRSVANNAQPPSRTTAAPAETKDPFTACRVLEAKVLYLRIQGMTPGTVARVRSMATARDAPEGFVILDLRGNTGGLAPPARELADLFLERGPILHLEGRGIHERQDAVPGTASLERARLAVLVDAQTAAGAEVVAAAVQDNHRGTVLGARTAGRAPVDLLYSVAGGGALRLTVARMLRANGAAIEGRGVSPDVALDGPVSSPEQRVADVPCRGFEASEEVAADPAVARAVSVLLAP